jgi:glycosyltransferase involved in cell wall biosynthesis
MISNNTTVGIHCRGISSGSGPARYTQRLIRGLNRYPNIELVLIHPKEENHKLFENHKQIQTWNRFHTPIHEVNMLPTEIGPFFHDLDILHYPMAFASPAFFISSADKIVVTVHGVESVQYPEGADFFRSRIDFMRRVLSEKIDMIFSVSETSKQNISEYFQYPAKDIKVTYNEAPENFYPAKSPPLDSLPKEYFLNVSNINNKKNIKRIIQSSMSGGRKYPVVLTATEKEIEKETDFNVPENVYPIGYVSDQKLPTLYSHSNALLFPSLQESFGMPIIEAMSCACPVITSNRSAMPEIAGDSALLVDPESTSEIREAMDVLWNDSAYRRYLSWKGFQRSQEFGSGTTAAQVTNGYYSLLND